MTDLKENTSVLFVCMGNICRSPTAEGVFRHLVKEAGLIEQIRSDSAGTHAYHHGSEPDQRAQIAAERRGFSLTGIKSRPITADDFNQFDYIIAMDKDNLEILREQAAGAQGHKVSMLLDYSANRKGEEVPDPYYGGATGFEKVLDLVEEASRGLLETLKTRIRT